MEVEGLKAEIESMKNITESRFDQMEKKTYDSTVAQYDDGFEGEYDDEEYDEDVAEEEPGPTKGSAGTGGSAGRRRRRSSSASYKQASADKDDLRGKRNVFGTSPIIANSPNAIVKQTWSKPGNRSKGIEAEIVLESVLPQEQPEPEVWRQPTANTCCNTIAAHLEGDISTVSHAKTTHYQGNQRVYQNGVIGEWEPAEWMRDLDMTSKFYLDSSRNGISIKEESQGLYFVYAQVFYADQHDTAGFGIYVNHENVFQCTVTSLHQAETHRHKTKSNSCYTGGLVKLTRGDKVTLREIEGTRLTVMHAPKSFLGMYRVQA
ncbi:hypothetical protein GE061_011158 [Apolygus lucorum]|uniref:THD domain-containing protein n=1 Tax=Apolygus lucorum TaxID=248454 RepID=A0A8S9XY23_APOLU|nr:hypothetical protein GE061_011158 [Apolygus lucorum]